jgi:integrase/recombinase XerD
MISEYSDYLNAITRNIKGARFSTTNKVYYTDASEDSLREILRAFKDKADVDISQIAYRSDFTGEDHIPPSDVKPAPVPEKIPECEDDHKNDEEHPVHYTANSWRSTKAVYAPVEFRIEEGRLSVKFTGYYNKKWIDEIKSYGRIYYDKVHREFLLQWSQMTVDSLSDYFSREGVKVRVIRQKPDSETLEARKNTGDEIRSRVLKDSACNGLELLRRHLEENRYSSRTVESYLAQLELFFKFYNDQDPHHITHNEVSDFMNGFVLKHGFSSSFQNQMVSAIKMFYEISGRGKVIPQILERPRRSRTLPKVFSKEEVARILNSAGNIKHKLLLWMIYSCGLRRSEVTNIRLNDIDRSRNLLHIREGKGGVDRIVPVPDKLWAKLDEYMECNHPQRYLFEGRNGQRYSVESVYNVFRKALRNAGIKKEVGVHSLRHSYATHLHENGLDIRYIQELLGHKSTRTTEIYTHVSRRNLVAVRSPIDDLDVK